MTLSDPHDAHHANERECVIDTISEAYELSLTTHVHGDIQCPLNTLRRVRVGTGLLKADCYKCFEKSSDKLVEPETRFIVLKRNLLSPENITEQKPGFTGALTKESCRAAHKP